MRMRTASITSFACLMSFSLAILSADPATRPEGSDPPAEPAWVMFGGRVIDEQTGEPVTRYALQWGGPDPGQPDRIAWGGSQTDTSSPRRGGEFEERSGRPKGQRAWLRVLAEGYAPQPVTSEPVTVPAERRGLVVRLNRGRELLGRVLHHDGAPVAGATVYLAGHQMLELHNGRTERFRGSTAQTNKEGRFSLSGAGAQGERVAVVDGPFHVWVATAPADGGELTVRLPEPAGLTIAHDIVGAGEVGTFRLELKTWELPEWRGAVQCIREIHVENGGHLKLNDLTPGVYDLTRSKMLRVGDLHQGVFCDRQTLTLEPGKAHRADIIRGAGSPVRGRVVGLEAAQMPGAFVFVHPPGANGDPRRRGPRERVLFDAVACGPDGRFETERLAPGEYTLVARAYAPEPIEGTLRTGLSLPSLAGTVNVTVPAQGEAPEVQIGLEPLAREAPPRVSRPPDSATSPAKD